MSLKAILFDFNGVIIKDEAIHHQLLSEILLAENLVMNKSELSRIYLGRSDRDCLQEILTSRGRVVTDTYLKQLLNRKAESYAQILAKLEKLPLYPGLDDLIFQARSRGIKLAIVSSAIRAEIELVLQKANLAQYFKVVIAGDDITTSKPEPDGYRFAVQRLNQEYPDLQLTARECLAIEDTPLGIQAAKRANMQVVGVANTYPFHMIQRLANWTVDYLCDLELERVQKLFTQTDQVKAI